MGIITLLRYWVGGRRAILTLAASRWSLALGLLFVLSAAFARDYDGEDLLSEPWHLAVPFVVSLTASLVLFCLAYAGAPRWTDPRPRFFPAYLCFLGLFWLTAPLAW